MRGTAAPFWSQTTPEPNTGCLLWLGTVNPQSGYAQLRVDGRTRRAHRVAYELAHGSVPADQVVRHRCDQPACVNPEHLELGTHADNVDDRHRRGRDAVGSKHGTRTKPERVPRGEAHGQCKLPDVLVHALRSAYALGGFSQTHLAQVYGLGQSQVSRIINHQNR